MSITFAWRMADGLSQEGENSFEGLAIYRHETRLGACGAILEARPRGCQRGSRKDVDEQVAVYVAEGVPGLQGAFELIQGRLCAFRSLAPARLFRESKPADAKGEVVGLAKTAQHLEVRLKKGATRQPRAWVDEGLPTGCIPVRGPSAG
jgi:hypothetical protein